MKTFWRILPYAIPLLVLAAVLSSCGTDKKGVTANIFDSPKATKETISGQKIKGSPVEHDLAALYSWCPANKGYLNMAKGEQVCAVRVATVTFDPANYKPDTLGDPVEILADAHKGYLITSTDASGGQDNDSIDIRLDAEKFTHVGNPMVLPHHGNLTFGIEGVPKAAATVFVYKCIGTTPPEEVECNTEIFRRH